MKQITAKLNRKIDPNINHEPLIELLLAVSYYDSYTGKHSQEVAALTYHIGQYLVSENELEYLYFGGLVHDVGKIAFSTHPKLYSGSNHLNEKEKTLIREHPQIGHDLVQSYTSSKIILEMVLNHHENLDGSGYPNQKNDKELSIYSRIIRITDTLSALTNYRAYRKKKQYSLPEAINILEESKHCYDPLIVKEVKRIML